MPKPKQPSAVASLSPQERAVLVAIAKGHTNAVIGADLGIGYETVKTYVNRLRTKLGRRTKTELAVYAVQHEVV